MVAHLTVGVSLLLTGCDRLPLKFNLLAKTPEDFKETDNTARIAPQQVRSRHEGKPKLSVKSKPTADNPLLGAALRLDPIRAAEHPLYRQFLLPQIILSLGSDSPVAITANFGKVAEDVRVLVPAGQFHVGLLPLFSMGWLSEMRVGGAVNVDMSIEGRWSRLRADDLFLKVNFAVVPPSLFPKKHLNPLSISMIETKARGLPDAPTTRTGDYLSWTESIFYELLPYTQKKRRANPTASGWVTLRSVENIVEAKDPTPLEMAILWGSLALRDGVPAWLTFVGDDVYLFVGGLPPDEKSFVLSPTIFLEAGGAGDFSKVLESSRNQYVDSILRGTDPDFIDTRDRFLFRDYPEKKERKIQAPDAPEEEAEQKNPFVP